MSLKRKMSRIEEKHEQTNIRAIYGKKPRIVCPYCHKKSLYMTNNKGEVFCVRCDHMLKK